MKYYIGPKVEKWTSISPHDKYIRNVLLSSLILKKESTINVTEIKNNASIIYAHRRNIVKEICDREYSKNNELLLNSNKLHG